MMDMIAQGAENIGCTLETVVTIVASVLAALAGREGIDAARKKYSSSAGNGSGNGNNNGYVSSKVCAERHLQQEKNLQERHDTILRALASQTQSIERIHDRIDKFHSRHAGG